MRRLLVVVLVLTAAATAVALRRGNDVPPPQTAASGAFPSARTAPRPPTIWAVGDGAGGNPDAAALGRRIAADDPARVLYLGDVYENGTPEEMQANMTDAYGPLLRRMLPTPGNHEWPNHPQGYDRFWRQVTGERTPSWYAVRLGAWTVLSLNSETPHDSGSAQLRWLRSQLADSRGRCVLAFLHRPRFSAGTHGDQQDVAPLWDAVAGRAALVLNGHDHDLQRLRPVQGTTELVSGAGGQSHYGGDEGDDRLAFSDDETDSALRLELGPASAAVSFVAVDGRVLDCTTVPCTS